MSMIKTEHLVFEYDKLDEMGNVVGKHRAIDGVNLNIEEGQFIAILGHNGMIKTEHLVFEYDKLDEMGNVVGKHRAIDGVNLNIEEGQFIAILGHNGSGKSTLAKHINAILTSTEGTMWVDGKDTKDLEKLWEIRQSAGMVFQNPDNQIIGTVVEEWYFKIRIIRLSERLWRKMSGLDRKTWVFQRRKYGREWIKVFAQSA